MGESKDIRIQLTQAVTARAGVASGVWRRTLGWGLEHTVLKETCHPESPLSLDTVLPLPFLICNLERVRSTSQGFCTHLIKGAASGTQGGVRRSVRVVNGVTGSPGGSPVQQRRYCPFKAFSRHIPGVRNVPGKRDRLYRVPPMGTAAGNPSRTRKEPQSP